MKVLVIIPAYQAEKSLDKVLKGLIGLLVLPRRILVVDDGSTDATSLIAMRHGVELIKYPVNRGKGEALKSGFGFAQALEYDAVITLDADGQHDPKMIWPMIDRAVATDADIVIGSRKREWGVMPPLRMFTNWSSSVVTSALARTWIPDSQSGYRLIRQSVLRAVKLSAGRYMTESELLIQAGRMGFKIAALPIATIYGSEKSHIKPGPHLLSFISLAWRYLLPWKIAP